MTGIRGIAAVWVLIYHVTTILQLPSWAGTAFAERGWAGVDLFFALSGFILMHAHGAELARPNWAILQRFAWLRVSRVYPLNTVVLLLILVLVLAAPGFAAFVTAHDVASLRAVALVRTALLGTVWLPSWGDWNQPVWSLSAELVGYALLPLIAMGLARVRIGAVPIALASFGVLAAIHVAGGRVGLNSFNPSSALPRMACCFIGGAAFYRARGALPASVAAWAGGLAGAAGLLLLACAFSTAGAEAMPVLDGVLIFALSYQRGIVDRALSSRVAIFLGAISFPLYLVHVMALYCLAWLFESGAVARGVLPVVICVLGSVILATGLHWGIELPVQRLSRRWSRRPVPGLRPTHS